MPEVLRASRMTEKYKNMCNQICMTENIVNKFVFSQRYQTDDKERIKAFLRDYGRNIIEVKTSKYRDYPSRRNQQ